MKTWDEYRRQEAQARAAEDSETLAHALRHLSELARVAGDPGHALACADEALGLYRASVARSALDLANALRLRALALTDLGGDPRPAWREARALYAECEVPAGVAECERRLAPAS